MLIDRITNEYYIEYTVYFRGLSLPLLVNLRHIIYRLSTTIKVTKLKSKLTLVVEFGGFRLCLLNRCSSNIPKKLMKGGD